MHAHLHARYRLTSRHQSSWSGKGPSHFAGIYLESCLATRRQINPPCALVDRLRRQVIPGGFACTGEPPNGQSVYNPDLEFSTLIRLVHPPSILILRAILGRWMHSPREVKKTLTFSSFAFAMVPSSRMVHVSLIRSCVFIPCDASREGSVRGISACFHRLALGIPDKPST